MSHMRIVGAALLILGVVGAGLVGPARPAAAGRHDTVAELSSWAYIDSVSPFKTFREGTDAPVGAWRDAIGRRHISKAYFTFTLPPLRGARIFGAEFNVFETHANDCTQPRSTELWLTDTDERPTWQYQPRERVKLAGPGGSTACTGWVGWDAGDAVRQAVTAGQSKITLAMRMPAGKQGDPAFGRRYASNPALSLTYNFPPGVPTNLAFDGQFCRPDLFLPNNWEHGMGATATDPDPGAFVAAQFAFWPVDQPHQRFEQLSLSKPSGSRFSVGVPNDLLADNHMYEWTARAFDGDDYSPWAQSCRFTTDFTPPDAAPTMSSVDYPDDGQPHGHPGTPGRFTFTANGVPDVVGFRWDDHDSPSEFVAADVLGGSATVTFTPRVDGPQDIFARSVDRAGNLGPLARYRFWVRGFAPGVTSSPANGGNGVPREFTFTPNMDHVVSYIYQFNNGPETTIGAAVDGTGRVTLTPDRPDDNVLIVRSVTENETVSPATRYWFYIVGGPAPAVRSDVYPEFEYGGGPGIPGTFDFAPTMPGVVEYVYTFNLGPETVVAARPDGSASVTITPTEAGDSQELAVFSRSADGTVSQRVAYIFHVGPAPEDG